MDDSSLPSAAAGFPVLRLPPADLVVRDGAVLCLARKRFVQLEPEEWVRQHWLAYLMGLGYPAGGMSVEHTLALNDQGLRADLVCHDRQGRPRLLAEFKAPNIRLDQAVLDQTLTYNLSICAPLVLISNGMSHHAYRLPGPGGEAAPLAGIPVFAD